MSVLDEPAERSRASDPERRQPSRRDAFAHLDLVRLLEIFRRRRPTIARSAAAVLVAAMAYLLLAPARYTGELLILVDPQKTEVLRSEAASAPDRVMDPGLVDSQVEILKSDSVLLQVIRNLNLLDDPDLTSPHGAVGVAIIALKSAIGALLPGASPRPETRLDRELAIVEILSREMKVKRVGLTYVIQVDYRGYDPEKAAAIANAIAEAYINGELEARYNAALRTGNWLRERIREMGDEASAADLAVQKYKSEHNIVDTSRGLIMEQRLADVNTQLVNASAATAEAKARLDRILEIVDSPIANAAVADTLHSDVISRLRAEYLDLDSKEADYGARFGKEHASVRNIHGQKIQLQNAAREELRRIAESTRSDYSIAAAREQSLKSSLDALIAASSRSNEAQGALRNLESTAETDRNLYETMLRKAEETTRQQSFPVAGDRVITPASPPDAPSWPKPLIVIPIAAILGLVIGCGVALSKEMLGDTFIAAEHVSRYAGLTPLGILPMIGGSPVRRRDEDTLDASPVGADPPAIIRHAVTAPFSRFSEIIRNAKASVDLCRGAEKSVVIGIVSSLPREGKTTVGANFALFCARCGQRAVLVDGDMHRRALTGLLAPDAEDGWIELLEGTATIDEVLRRDETTGLEFIPCAAVDPAGDVVTRLASPEMADLYAELRGRYDYVVVDLPSIVAVLDAEASAAMIDQFVLVVEWGRTSRDAVLNALAGAEEVRRRTIGVILNKAEPGALKRMNAW